MKKKTIIDLILNVVIILSVSIGMSLHIILDSNSGMDGDGVQALRYFTNLSNIYCAIIALWVVIVEIRMLAKKEIKELSHVLMIFRLTATTGVAVTFFTVGFIFLPLIGFNIPYLYSGQKVMTHLTTPLLAIFSYIFVAQGKGLNWKEDFFSIIPEFLYAIVYEIEVPILGNWNDFYGFTLGGKWYAPFIVAPTICGIAYLCSFLISLANKKVAKNQAKKLEESK